MLALLIVILVIVVPIIFLFMGDGKKKRDRNPTSQQRGDVTKPATTAKQLTSDAKELQSRLQLPPKEVNITIAIDKVPP